MKKISIVIPAYNEEKNLTAIHQKLQNVFSNLSNYSYEIIFVNDGSKDNTQEKLEELASDFYEVKFMEFSRNFGHQSAVKAGLDFATGDAIISMDADLQHPPELIPELIKQWEDGYDIVYTIREYPKKISYFKKTSSSSFYKILNKISDINIEKGDSDFRLIDQSVLEVIRNWNEDNLFLRGIIKWVGFKQIGVHYTADERFSGESKYTFEKMIKFAVTGVTSFSVKPLHIAIYLGFVFTFLSVILFLFNVLRAFYLGTEVSGWASLILTIVFFGGMQMSILGIIGLYIGKIFTQVKDRPSYIVRNKNF